MHPAITNTAPAAHLSSRYVLVSSQAVVEAMAAEGFHPNTEARAYDARSPRAKATPTGRHIIDFRRPGDKPGVGDAVPRVLFGNSHDGSTRAWLRVGVFRLVCANGLVVPEGATEAFATRHSGDMARDLIRRAQNMARNTHKTFEQIDRWSKIELSRPQAEEFARLASVLRWDDPHRISPADALEVRRDADEGMDLWRVFNRVQEATTRVALPAVARSGRAVTTRALAEPFANTAFNEQLWALAEEFAEG